MRIGDTGLKWLFLAPTLLLLLFIVVFPLIWSLGLSFCKYNATRDEPPLFVGLQNYRRLLSSPDVWRRFTVTGRYVLLAVAGEFALGFGLALLLNRRFYGKGLITTLFLLPMMFSPVVIGTFFRFMLDPNWGIVDHVLSKLGLPRIAWTSDPRFAIYSLVICDVWIWTPFMILMTLAGLSTVPPYLYEAAEIDRASWWLKFRYITLPHIAPILILALLFRTMDAIRFFDQVYVLTGGGPGEVTETVPFYIYKVAFSYWRTGESCALAYILVIVIIGLSSIYIHYLNKVRGR
ncbi:sugar ABC transporter permease [Candidatus Poribacteria bacterium]|nr:MAG: sugar ABC transporter permease [Candidatus Poribacteria bacterium]